MSLLLMDCYRTTRLVSKDVLGRRLRNSHTARPATN